MAKKRRDKKISLTQTKKKGLEGKHKLVDDIRSCLANYEHVCVFSHENMRNSKMQDIKIEWKSSSRFFLGKNRVMALALGRTTAEEVSENIHLISEKLVEQRGLLFTNKSKEEVLSYFDALQSPDFARAGNIASETVELPEGHLKDFSHTIEPQLRKLGLPTKLDRGIPSLLKAHTVCKKGDVLNSDQAKVLKLLGHEQAFFRLRFEFIWSKDGSFEDLGRAKLVPSQHRHRKLIIGKKNTKNKRKKKGKKASSDGEDQDDCDDEEGSVKLQIDEDSDKDEVMDASDDE